MYIACLCPHAMVSKERTIKVDADTYSDYVPDDLVGDTIEIEVVAFGDKVYLKLPRWERSGTNDFCVNAMSLFQATIRVTDRGGLEVEPVLRRMNVLLKQERDYVTGNDSDVQTTILGDLSDADPAHLQLVEEFTTTISGFQEDDYWIGYKRAANKFGDDRYQWPDVAWDCFEDEWDGNTDLMLEAGEWLAREGMAVCSRSNALFPAPEWTTPTGSYVATISDVYDGTCPYCGADKDEYWECIESPASTRRGNLYRCNECGETKRGISTG